jgi:hypothetical protein
MKVSDFIGVKAKYDEDGQFIWGIEKDGGHQILICLDKTIDLDAAASFQDEFGRWIVEAINEKLERER